MKILIVDADLISRSKHRFPNLACEKISGYWKTKGADVNLITKFPTARTWQKWQSDYDEIYVSSVFTDTYTPDYIKASEHVHVGGTGFYFDKAPALPDEIEHHMPDYNLYDNWIEQLVKSARLKSETNGTVFDERAYRKQFSNYTDYSIGFLTRGCFRKCPFCVNQKYDHVFKHSPLEEFHDPTRKKLCFLDDNFFGCAQWRELLNDVISTKKKFMFKQGLDERLLNDEKAEILFSSKYDGDYIFAFDNISDYDLIHEKLELIKKYNIRNKSVKFYVLVGFESVDAKDIENMFKRIELLFEYHCLPYIMRYRSADDVPYEHSKYKQLYTNVARWCNQVSIVKKMTFREFCLANQKYSKTQTHICSALRSMLEFENDCPEIAARYFDMRFGANI